MDPDPDPGVPKTCGSGGSRFGSASATLQKRKEKFLIYSYKDIQNGAVAKSYMTNGLLIYG
jgi:hypothetical protein